MSLPVLYRSSSAIASLYASSHRWANSLPYRSMPARSKPSMMFNAWNMDIPHDPGGIAYRSWPWKLVVMGSRHSTSYDSRSALVR